MGCLVQGEGLPAWGGWVVGVRAGWAELGSAPQEPGCSGPCTPTSQVKACTAIQTVVPPISSLPHLSKEPALPYFKC